MDLQFIKTTSCPICGCDVVHQEYVEIDDYSLQHRQHCNGTKWEHRRFACGQEIYYCPNGNREYLDKIHNTCKKDPALLEKEQKKAQAKENLFKYIEELDVDDKTKSLIKWRLENV